MAALKGMTGALAPFSYLASNSAPNTSLARKYKNKTEKGLMTNAPT